MPIHNDVSSAKLITDLLKCTRVISSLWILIMNHISYVIYYLHIKTLSLRYSIFHLTPDPKNIIPRAHISTSANYIHHEAKPNRRTISFRNLLPAPAYMYMYIYYIQHTYLCPIRLSRLWSDLRKRYNMQY